MYQYLLSSDAIVVPVMVNLTETLALLGSLAYWPLDGNYNMGPPGFQTSVLGLIYRHNCIRQVLIISLFLYNIHSTGSISLKNCD